MIDRYKCFFLHCSHGYSMALHQPFGSLVWLRLKHLHSYWVDDIFYPEYICNPQLLLISLVFTDIETIIKFG